MSTERHELIAKLKAASILLASRPRLLDVEFSETIDEAISLLEADAKDGEMLDHLEKDDGWFVNVTNEIESDEETSWTVLKWVSEDNMIREKGKTLRQAITAAMAAERREAR